MSRDKNGVCAVHFTENMHIYLLVFVFGALGGSGWGGGGRVVILLPFLQLFRVLQEAPPHEELASCLERQSLKGSVFILRHVLRLEPLVVAAASRLHLEGTHTHRSFLYTILYYASLVLYCP